MGPFQLKMFCDLWSLGTLASQNARSKCLSMRPHTSYKVIGQILNSSIHLQGNTPHIHQSSRLPLCYSYLECFHPNFLFQIHEEHWLLIIPLLISPLPSSELRSFLNTSQFCFSVKEKKFPSSFMSLSRIMFSPERYTSIYFLSPIRMGLFWRYNDEMTVGEGIKCQLSVKAFLTERGLILSSVWKKSPRAASQCQPRMVSYLNFISLKAVHTHEFRSLDNLTHLLF